MSERFAYTIFPLGDNALTVDFGNSIDEAINRKVLALFHSFRENPIPGCIETVPAYSSLTIYYDLTELARQKPAGSTGYQLMAERTTQRLLQTVTENKGTDPPVRIPVCYDPEFGWDIMQLAAEKNLSPDEVVRIHSSGIYGVYMLGFLPGFAYMGKVTDEIAMPRKVNPRPVVDPGSVGIAGHQTGIYPLSSPGGWQIIGRTPLKLFDLANHQLTLLKPGDKVQFYSISKDEFTRY